MAGKKGNDKNEIYAQGIKVFFYREPGGRDYVSLTDIARYRSDKPASVIANWLRNRDVLQYLGLWETLHNERFKLLEFEEFMKQAGYNAFAISPKQWIDRTCSIGMVSRSGRSGGTFAHTDIAFEFASWVSPEFI